MVGVGMRLDFLRLSKGFLPEEDLLPDLLYPFKPSIHVRFILSQPAVGYQPRITDRLDQKQVENRRTNVKASNGDRRVEQAFFKTALGAENSAFASKSSAQTCSALLQKDGNAQEHREGDHGDGKNE